MDPADGATPGVQLSVADNLGKPTHGLMDFESIGILVARKSDRPTNKTSSGSVTHIQGRGPTNSAKSISQKYFDAVVLVLNTNQRTHCFGTLS